MECGFFGDSVLQYNYRKAVLGRGLIGRERRKSRAFQTHTLVRVNQGRYRTTGRGRVCDFT